MHQTHGQSVGAPKAKITLLCLRQLHGLCATGWLRVKEEPLTWSPVAFDAASPSRSTWSANVGSDGVGPDRFFLLGLSFTELPAETTVGSAAALSVVSTESSGVAVNSSPLGACGTSNGRMSRARSYSSDFGRFLFEPSISVGTSNAFKYSRCQEGE